MKEYYYYQRSFDNKPMITNCLLIDPETKQYSIGKSVCSYNDNPCKRIGKKIALERAKSAMKMKGGFVNNWCKDCKKHNHPEKQMFWKALYKPHKNFLTPKQQQILERELS